ncbi:MAG: hypothetical protein ACTSP6_03515 [Promethearchaeota archaeon]
MLCWLLGLVGLMKSKKGKTSDEDRDQNVNNQTVIVEKSRTKQTISDNPDFCPNCGTTLNEREPVQYCPYCGITIGKVNTIHA